MRICDALTALFFLARQQGCWNHRLLNVLDMLPKRLQPEGRRRFLAGFVLDGDSVWGRPAGVAVTHDGALLVSDDANAAVFRVIH